ncbi:neutral alpha-glucosidase C [Pelobates fuscus]|uniref:neutral alpha-glucosidase C n=1 Tax=Pelobates fuscus TaxID=191477 RepID=UPI002FE4F2F4
MSSMESAPLPPQASEADDIIQGVLTENKSKFKTPNQIGFYRRQKLLLPGQSLYHAQLDTFKIDDAGASLKIIHQDTNVPYQLQVIALKGGIVRLKIKEFSPLKTRYEVSDVLIKETATERFSVSKQESDNVVLDYQNGLYKLHIAAHPFSVTVTQEEKALLSINSQGLLYFESGVSSPPGSVATEGDIDAPQDSSKEEFGLWKEESGDRSLTSVGLDFSLHGFEHVYGIPEHADTHRLQDCGDSEVYRLYNLDVFGYSVCNKMGIYGSVPLLLAHKPSHTCGIFWLNSSETMVETHYKAALQTEFSQAAPVTRKKKAVPMVDVRWMSESGIVDVFLLLGPAPQDVFNQYAQLTGTQAFPTRFSLGYHQCRWNYEDEADVEAVDSGFDEHHIPYDVIWLDIEHTDGKRYFTWDPVKFSDPLQMQKKLQEKKRKLVVISDPHIKVDPNYSLYAEAKEKGFFVKDRNGEDFVGTCWPGSSSYLDFTNPAVRDWYSSQFALDAYKGSTDALFVWNDMNEPSVFESPEMTMPKYAVHHLSWEHRDVHNLYGFYQQMSTSEGLIRRSGGQERPFVLTRSFFAGSQRYGAVWTGDNKAEWEYLKISIPMLLSLSVAGISFCGADIGGFVGDPEPELLVRWYQAGSFQPFFRAHAIRDSKRREPWLFGEGNTLLIRNSIEERYTLLPYLYLLFYRAHVSAELVMRPFWVEFPKNPETFGVETQYMLGSALMVAPVLVPGVSSLDVLFPGPKELWYNFRNYKCIKGQRKQKVGVTLDEIPVYQRGGSIIPMHTAVGKSTGWMEETPYKLHVALNSKGSASGELYVDDGHSFKYQHDRMFIYRHFTFQKNVLSCKSAKNTGHFSRECILKKVLVMGLKKMPSEVNIISPGKEKTQVTFTYSHKLGLLTMESLSLDASADWEIHIVSSC